MHVVYAHIPLHALSIRTLSSPRTVRTLLIRVYSDVKHENIRASLSFFYGTFQVAEIRSSQMIRMRSSLVPRDVQPGGYWSEEPYCGPVSWVYGWVFPLIICWPIDKRRIYIDPNGVRHIL